MPTAIGIAFFASRVAINGMLDDQQAPFAWIQALRCRSRIVGDPDAPWGGFKYSGVGREFGSYGIEAFLKPRAVLE
jgi:aldehyde dehydrogenase (NAD+)